MRDEKCEQRDAQQRCPEVAQVRVVLQKHKDGISVEDQTAACRTSLNWCGAGQELGRCPKFEQVGRCPCSREGVRASGGGDFEDFPCSYEPGRM